jgi:hypothetical protein
LSTKITNDLKKTPRKSTYLPNISLVFLQYIVLSVATVQMLSDSFTSAEFFAGYSDIDKKVDFSAAWSLCDRLV